MTAVATVGVGVQAMFFSDYHIDGFEGQDHVFTDVQRDARHWIDRNIYGIDVDAAVARKQEKSDSATNGSGSNNPQRDKL